MKPKHHRLYTLHFTLMQLKTRGLKSYRSQQTNYIKKLDFEQEKRQIQRKEDSVPHHFMKQIRSFCC